MTPDHNIRAPPVRGMSPATKWISGVVLLAVFYYLVATTTTSASARTMSDSQLEFWINPIHVPNWVDRHQGIRAFVAQGCPGLPNDAQAYGDFSASGSVHTFAGPPGSAPITQPAVVRGTLYNAETGQLVPSIEPYVLRLSHNEGSLGQARLLYDSSVSRHDTAAALDAAWETRPIPQCRGKPYDFHRGRRIRS